MGGFLIALGGMMLVKAEKVAPKSKKGGVNRSNR